jgi:ribosomal-protein-alanine N-acetyltransferase
VSDALTGVEVRLRKMSIEDVARVHKIDTLSFSLPWPERSYRFEVVENVNSSCWVAEVLPADGPAEVVGMIVNWIILDEVHIATLAFTRITAMELRKLLVHGLWKASARRATGLPGGARRQPAAQALYRRFGFVVAGVRHAITKIIPRMRC